MWMRRWIRICFNAGSHKHYLVIFLQNLIYCRNIAKAPILYFICNVGPGTYYIFMADIIQSRSYQQKGLHAAFAETVAKANSLYKDGIISPLTITLGDEFQGIVSGVNTAVQLAFYLDQGLLGQEVRAIDESGRDYYDLRYSLYYGEIDTPINTEVAHSMLGNGLTSARELLEKVKNEDAKFYFGGLNPDLCKALNVAFRIYDSFYSDWKSQGTRMLVKDLLEIDDYKVVAERHGKDPSSVWRRRKSLKIQEYKDAKEMITRILAIWELFVRKQH